ncbi:MAG: hypothetical protein ACJ72E_09520 [Marmoricola sp.]
MSEQAEPGQESETTEDPARQWRLLAGVLALLLLASLVTLVVLIARGDDGSGSTGSGSSVLGAERAADKAARTAAVELTTYDWRSLDQDFSWVEDGGTPAFQQRYAEVSAPIRTFVLKIKAHLKGSVVDSAARATDADHAVVLLFVDQTITNDTNSDHTLDQPRMTMTMVRTGGRWLVDDVKINNLTTG